MKLKTEILLVFLIVGACLTIGTGVLYFYNARQIILEAASNQLESLSATKKHRLESIIYKKQEELRLVQSRLFQAEYLYQYNVFGQLSDTVAQSDRRLITKNIKKLTHDIESFKNIHVLNKEGIVIASTDSGSIHFNFSYFDFVQKALKLENSIYPIIDYKTDDIYLCLAGPIYYKQKLQGALLIETTTADLATLTGDYTGLGNTGETTIGQLLADTVACFITPTRNKECKFEKVFLNKIEPQSIFLALAGNEKLFLNVLDYNHKRVAASCRYIAATQWGIVTKIDMDELMAPAEALKWMSIRIGLGALFFLFLVSMILASSIVKPINKISEVARKVSQGDWSQQVRIHSNNELGDLAVSFNRMTKSLIEAQENLELKIEELDKSNVSLEKFAFVVSHDLRSPLNSVLGIAELLGTGNMGSLNDDGLQMLKLMQNKIEHMKGMIAGILEFARLNHQLPTHEVVDLELLIARLKSLDCGNVAIEVAQELPPLNMNTVVAEQLFQNLWSNAVKYNKSEQKKIVFSAYQSENDTVYSVTDNGIGIGVSHFDTIFEIFHTVGPKGSDSTGIGLAIVKKIVESYGGKIWIKSQLGEGSTFFFTLPYAQVNSTIKQVLQTY